MDGISDRDLDGSSFDPRGVVVIVGPTGSGKSGLAMNLATKFPIEIVCMDSMQLYAETRIGTARPSQEECEAVPHHLFGSEGIEQGMTSIRYKELATRTISDIQKRNALPVLVGGTGLYLRALFEGMAEVPTTPASLRKRLDDLVARRGKSWLYRMLQRLDPRGAEHLHANDRQRVQRFLEVRILSGRSMLEFWKEQKDRQVPRPIAIGLEVERALLLQRLERRLLIWLEQGWIDEVRWLNEQGLLDAVLEVGPIGYLQIYQYISGILSYEEMVERILIATRQYAKRQMTWFRKASYIQWFPFEPNSGYNIKSVTDFIERNMGLPSESGV